MTEQQRNAVIRLIDAAETVVADFDRMTCDQGTRDAVQEMATEIRNIRAEDPSVEKPARSS